MVSATTDESVVVNVKDFGAVGDGKTDDRAAMLAAFDYAVYHYASKSIPVTVYFPEGEYGLLRGGMYIKMPFGSGNLTVKGAGADKSTIVYLDEWDNNGSWVAIRLQLAEKPSSVDDYLHDIVIQDLGVYDTDPAKHAWHVDKGDPDTEETHGFNIQHCVRATIQNCKTVDMGDECFDLSHCIDSRIVENVAIKYRITGKGGGSLSVGDGSKNVVIANNLVFFDTDDTSRSHYGLAVEALTEYLEEIYVFNNEFVGLNGWGVDLVAPNGSMSNVLIQDNVMTDCLAGGVHFSGAGQTNDVRIIRNQMRKVGVGVYVDGGNKDQTLVENCVIDDISDCGIKVGSPSSNDTIVRNTIITNSQGRAAYNAGTNTKLDRLYINGIGLSGGITDGAITQYGPGGDSELSNSVLLNCLTKKGTQCVQRVINVYIEQPEISGYVSMQKVSVVKNCYVNRYVQPVSGCTIEGMVLRTEVDLGTYALYLNNMSGCTVKDCVFILPSRQAVYENGMADNNIITNNVTIGGNGIKVIGANTVASDNATGMVDNTDMFRYRIVDGKATIMGLLDTAVEEVVIPATIGGYPVVEIESWTFALCDKLTVITIPDSVTSIGANAFYFCDALANVNYTGSRAAWEAIAIGDNNDALLSAAWYSPAALYSDTVRHSVMDTDNGNGLAFRFELRASGVKTVSGTRANLANATVNYFGTDCKLIGMGAVVTNDMVVGEGALTLDVVNGASVVDVPTVYLQEVSADSCAFATRIINIPDSAMSRKLYARPYCIIEVDGEQITVYGTVNVTSCSDVMVSMLDLDEHYMNNVQTALPLYQSKAVGRVNTLTFTMMSDPHLRVNAPHIVDNVAASSAWANLVGNDFIMISGDFIIGNLDKQTSLGLIDTAIEAAGSYGAVPVYAIKGNHDTNEDYKIGTDPETGKAVYSTADRITDEEFYARAIAHNETTIVTDPANPYGGYYYVDYPKQKIRVICLNTTEDRDGVDILDSTKNDFRWSGVKSVEQLLWIANTALQVADGWAVMMISHIPPITGQDVGVENETSADAPFHTRGVKSAALTELCEAFVGSGVGTVTAKTMVDGVAENVTISYDFTALNDVEFIGYFSGHVHEDSVSQYNGITYVVVNCTTPEKRWDTSLDREVGTETALSLNSFIVDRDTRTVECVKIGTGESFSFTW